jgi:preprotein translocase subunit SecG
MYQVIIVIHVLLGLCIIGLILMQQGKGADAGATFGGGASGSVFGAQGASSFLSRTTAILATMFFITSLGLAWLNANRTGAAVDFMGGTQVESVEPDVGLPNVDSSNSKEIPPVPSPESKSDTVIPASPPAAKPLEPVSPAPTAAPEATLEKIDVPKAADIKAVEEQKAEPKPELKQEQPSKAPAKKK